MDGGWLGYRGGVSETSGLNALTKTNETETGGKKRRKGDTGGDDDAASLRVKLAVAEAETATAKEEIVSWKKDTQSFARSCPRSWWNERGNE